MALDKTDKTILNYHRFQDPSSGRLALKKLQPELERYAECVAKHLKARPMAKAAAVYTSAAPT
jgi:hypothetical protein